MKSAPQQPVLTGSTPPFSLRLATILTLMAFLISSGLSPDATAAKRKSRKKGKAPIAASPSGKTAETLTTAVSVDQQGAVSAEDRFDDTVQRYLPDNCQVFGWIDVTPVLNSPMGKTLTKDGADFRRECQEKFGPLGIRPDQIERVVYGGGSLADGGVSEIVAVVFCNQPVPAVDEGATSEDSPWSTIEVGSKTLWVKDGESPWAASQVDDRVIIVGHPTPVGQVLSRRESTALPERLDRARLALDASAPFAIAFLPPQEHNGIFVLPFPAGSDLSSQVESVCIELRFDDQMAMKLSAFCQDEDGARQLHGMTSGLLTLIQMQGLNEQPPETRQLLQSLRLEVNGPQLIARMKVPASMVGFNVNDSDAAVSSGGLLLFPTQQNQVVSAVSETPALSPCCPPSPVSPATSTPQLAVAPSGSYGGQPSYPAYPTPAAGGVAWATPYSHTPQPIAFPGQPRPAVTVAETLRLVEAGVDDVVVVTFLNKRCLETELTVDDLIDLTKAEADSNVIITLQQLPVKPPADQATPASDAPNPLSTNRPA